MLKRLLSKLTGDRQQIERHLKNQYRAEENGFHLSTSSDPLISQAPGKVKGPPRSMARCQAGRCSTR